MKQLHTLILCLLVTLGSSAWAQGLKVGVIDSERILRDSAPAKQAGAQLEAEFSEREQALTKLGAQLQQELAQIEREAPTMTKVELAKVKQSFDARYEKFQQRNQLYKEDLAAKKAEKMEQLFAKTNKVIRRIAQQEKYDLILQQALYFSPALDLTDKIIQEMDK